MANTWKGRFPFQESATPDQTMPVGSFTPNCFGLYDMTGNVWLQFPLLQSKLFIGDRGRPLGKIESQRTTLCGLARRFAPRHSAARTRAINSS
jgi:hypothetical protein